MVQRTGQEQESRLIVCCFRKGERVGKLSDSICLIDGLKLTFKAVIVPDSRKGKTALCVMFAAMFFEVSCPFYADSATSIRGLIQLSSQKRLFVHKKPLFHILQAKYQLVVTPILTSEVATDCSMQ